MTTFGLSRRVAFNILAIFLGLFAFVGGVCAVVDDSATQGVWKLKYGVTNSQLYIGGNPPNGLNITWLNGDDDGDGVKNKDEIAAGTNPFSPGSSAKITSINVAPTTVNLTFSTEVGKQYVVQGTAALTTLFAGLSPSVTWTGTGGSKTLASIPKGTNKYFRILVQDIDTDGDGVSNWSEAAVGLNPAVAETISGLSTLAYVNQQVALPNVVTIKVASSFASEDGPTTGSMTIERTINLFPTTVTYGVGGTASSGIDYQPLAGSVNLPVRGPLSQNVSVIPMIQATVKGSRSVTATLNGPAAGDFPFTVGSPNAATVIINPSTGATGTGLFARIYDHANLIEAHAANFGDAANYAFTRAGTTPNFTGTAVISPTGVASTRLATLLAALTPNTTQVKLSFNGGTLSTAVYNHQSFLVTAKTAVNFTVALPPGSGLPTSSTSTCFFSIQPLHPALIERVDLVVNNDWIYGTPNSVTISPMNSADNYSSVWETYLAPTTAGSYIFQLDADDRARVLLDTDADGPGGLVQILEHGWDGAITPETIGTFKQSTAYNLAIPASAGQRYRLRVEHVDASGDARCRLQWNVNGGTFGNIPQANQFTHTQAQNYSYTAGNLVVTPTGGHSRVLGETVDLSFFSGALFTPAAASTFNGNHTITAVNGITTFTVAIPPTTVTVAGASTTANSNTVTVPSVAGLYVGMSVTGMGLPANEFITAIGVTTITITTGTGVTAQAPTTLTCRLGGFPISVPNATTTAGSQTVLVPSIDGLAAGMSITGLGLPTNATISVVGPGMILLSTATGVTTQASTTLTAFLHPTNPLNGSGFVLNNSASATTGVYNLVYPNITFTGSPGRVGTNSHVTEQNNGMWGSGTPDGALINPDTFSIRWTGQVQSQFSEEHTFVVHADDGSSLRINGQLQEMKTSPSTGTGGTYDYSSVTGDAVVNYTASVVKPGSFTVGESVRVDPTIGNLTHGNGSTYTYDGVTGALTVTYSNLANITPGGFIVGETIELDPTSGSLTSLATLPYVITSEPSTSTFTVFVEPGIFDSQPVVTVPNASTSAGSATVTVPSTTGLIVGMLVTGTGIPANQFITAIGAGQITITTGTGVTAEASTTLACASTINILDTRNASVSKLFATGATYSYDAITGAAVVNYSAVTGVAAGAFTDGMSVELDPTSASVGTLHTLTNTAYPITVATATTFTVNLGTTFTTCTGNMNIASSANNVIPAAITNAFAISFGTAKYTSGVGNINVEIVNKPLKEWSSMGNERYVRIPMIGGTRYDIQLDYYDNTGTARCQLYWYSPSQPKQIIPRERLYPSNLTANLMAPAAHISPTQATALVGGPFSLPIAGSNGASVTVSGLPAGLTYAAGVISGIPTAAGDYQILITLTNAAGTSTSVLNLHVETNAATVVREYWSGVSGTAVATIPTGTSPTGTANLASLAAPTGFGTSYGARIRGYITAPVTGNYYFWIASNNASELWISNDDEPINAFKRAWVNTGTATPQTWNTAVTQKSPWLALDQGRKYYFEILHKAGNATELGGAGLDNLAVGWLKPGQSGTAPSEVVPGFVLSPYVAPAPGSTPGTLYVATLLRQSGAVDPVGSTLKGVGTATMRLNESETVAYIRVSYSGLSGTFDGPYVPPGVPVAADGSSVANGVIDPTDWHVHSDPYLDKQSFIIYDGVEPTNGADGPKFDASGNFLYHQWTLSSAGTLSVDDVRSLIKQGKAYINLHTVLNGAGEIRGNFTLANGSRTFTPPSPPPAWTDDSGTNAGASRFLAQASFGASTGDIAAFKALSATAPVPAMSGVPASRYNTWIDAQFAMAADPNLTLLKEVIRTENASAQGGAFNNNLLFNAWWWRSITAPDQLRQRVAFALSEIHVVSAQGPLDNNALATSHFYDTLTNGVPAPLTVGAFGNFRDIIEDTTLTPGMGRYLDMLRNDKPDQTLGRIPNENYAREIKQLFSIGLYRMWPNGTLMLTSKDNVIDTYKQPEIVGFAHVFTGWDYGYDGAHRTALNAPANWTRPMRAVPLRHYTGAKLVLNNEVLPGLTTLGGQPLDPIATHTPNNYNSTAYENLPVEELDATHDQLFNHPNTGPFICRQLIQRLVTSHPSTDYVYRVVQKFNNNGSGVRGDMKAVIKAILLDYEARSNGLNAESLKPAYGKQREPVMRVAAAARAFRTTPWTGTYSQTGTRTIMVNVTAGGPHGLENGDAVFLDFTSGSLAPWIGTYGAGTPLTATSFTVQAAGWNPGTYAQTAGSNVMTVMMGSHWLQNGHQAYFDFTSLLTGTLPADGVFTVANSATTDNPNAVVTNTFTITMPDTNARTGNLMIPRFTPGSYTVSASGLPPPNDRRVTMDTNFNHELTVGQQVQLNFFDGNPLPGDRVATVEQVIDLNTWTFLAPSAGSNLNVLQGNNSVYQFPLQPLPMTRSGNVGNRASTFEMNSTTTDLEQSPVNSPTVFNFFLPDYKFPGTLQSQGITTPEFELTAETTVVRQSNYLYNGLFGSNNVNGINSFNNGNHALVMDFFPWYGNAVSTAGTVGAVLGAGAQTGQTWTSNANLSTLVDRLNVLLVGEVMPPAAKNIVLKFLDMRAITAISAQNPCRITSTGHNLNTGDVVTISGVAGGTFTGGLGVINTTLTITRIDDNVFSVPVNCTAAPIAGNLTSAVAPVVPYSNTSPSDTNKRDRLRAILHFILTSPEYTIQR